MMSENDFSTISTDQYDLASQSLTPSYKIHAHTVKYSRNLVILSWALEGRGREGERGGRPSLTAGHSVAGH